MTDPSGRRSRAVAAATAVAAAHGVRSAGAQVLHDGVNVVVHLPPAPVVARVATLTPLLRPDPARPFGREVAVAGVLASAGAAVVLAEDGTIEDAAIGLTAVGLEGLAVEAGAVLLGQRPGEEIFADAGRLAAEASAPVEDQRGPVDYKRHLADELTRRVLRTATARAGALADVSGG